MFDHCRKTVPVRSANRADITVSIFIYFLMSQSISKSRLLNDMKFIIIFGKEKETNLIGISMEMDRNQSGKCNFIIMGIY